ncbi:hypothetical protein [Microbispora amethystogenes]|uniref:Guanylate cyclase domain-containing protein n=1 Tax=Microbispora amethystogenes TaxID=1427754 RepID=A0ABQ4FF26_9ACTN|nr:hypothetical protein [Microbispora amethystogenes]GIH33425.1 hypothetical protein Mam01_35890 [Microbispora amethystogenes]
MRAEPSFVSRLLAALARRDDDIAAPAGWTEPVDSGGSFGRRLLGALARWDVEPEGFQPQGTVAAGGNVPADSPQDRSSPPETEDRHPLGREERRVHRESVTTAEVYSEPLLTPAQSSTQPAAEPATVRLFVAADIEDYSRFRADMDALRAQQRLVDLLAAARRRAGIDESRVELQEQGDGQFAVLPPAIDEVQVVPNLIRALRQELRQLNAGLSARERLRLRVAIGRGSVRRGRSGYTGSSVLAAYRMLNVPSVRAALSAEDVAMLGITLSQSVYEAVVAEGGTQLDPADFRQVTIGFPEKGFEETAWMLVPRPLAIPQ